MLEGVGGLLFALDWRWLSGTPDGGDARKVLVEALRAGSQTFVEYGPVLRAISDAAGYDARVEEVYRGGLIQRLVAAVAGRIGRDIEAGVTPDDLDPDQTARALVLMTERYLLDAFGRPERRPSRRETADDPGYGGRGLGQDVVRSVGAVRGLCGSRTALTCRL